MKVTFLGATREVTGSNFLVEACGKKFLVDLGLYQGGKQETAKNFDPLLFNVEEIDFMLLTHAHIDHSGRIPKLYKDGYRNPVYATKATCDLCSIMLPDSGHIQEQECEWKNRKKQRQGKEWREPLYTAEEAKQCLEVFKPVLYDQIIDVAEGIQVRFNDAGHMLGSSIIEIWITENEKTEKVVFTGDIGNNDILLLDSPTMIDNADYVIMESTYGNRLHMRNDDKAEMFLNIVSETLNKNGRVIIPSFAVGRTQEILYEMNNLKSKHSDREFYEKYEKLMHTDVYVDSPLAISATEIFEKNMDLFEEKAKAIIASGENPIEFPGLQFTRTSEESKALNETNEPCIIISASGMCEVGRIKHHLKHSLWNPNNTILFVGYQAEGTLGRRIAEGAEKVKIFGEEITINARIEYIEGFSGHADQEWLMNFIYSFITKPKHIFLVHGEYTGQKELKEKIIKETQIPVTIPEFGDIYQLEDVPTIVSRVEKPNREKYLRLEILERIETLKEEIEDMGNMIKGDTNK